MLSFYDVDVEYAKYLRQFDDKIPYITYNDRNKFVCGIVLRINGLSYYAPISSKTIKRRTCMLILNKRGQILSSIKFNYMFPIPPNAAVRKDFSAIRAVDPKYADLLQAEYEFCKKNEDAILAKANKIYAIGCNPNHALHFTCCNFPLLEKNAKNIKFHNKKDARRRPFSNSMR